MRVPVFDARVVLVVAGDEVHAARRPQGGEGRHLLAQLVDAAVHQVAGDGDEVGRKLADALHHVREPVLAQERPDVHVRDLHQLETGQLPRQAAQRDGKLFHLRGAERALHAGRGQAGHHTR